MNMTINLFLFIILISIYAWLLLLNTPPPPSSNKPHSSLLSPSTHSSPHNHKERQRVKRKAMMGGNGNATRISIPRFLEEMGDNRHIGTVNMEGEDLWEWRKVHRLTPIVFPTVPSALQWKDIFPEWIDEEEESDGPSCPEIPMPDFNTYEPMDLVLAKLPCREASNGSERCVKRLQMHLVAATMTAEKGKEEEGGRTKVVILSKCRPMIEIFRCDDLVRVEEGGWWFFMPSKWRIKHKLSLPLGSCQLALPLWLQGVDMANNIFEKKEEKDEKLIRREAYATILHSSGAYVCGAIALAQSLIKTGTKRELVMLMDKRIGEEEREAIREAGWKIVEIKRIRNPKGEKKSYNEYNYSKLRLWQQTNYTKIIFVDSDMIVVKNMDLLFSFPQMSAVGNHASFFNSGLMVIEPSLCTYTAMASLTSTVVSSNGGDQGFLNEVFLWWHRLPRRVNMLKNFWSNSSLEVGLKNQLFGDGSKVYAIHYLGIKPWLCRYPHRDCNWDVPAFHIYASDVAHQLWWNLHRHMNLSLHRFCNLPHSS